MDRRKNFGDKRGRGGRDHCEDDREEKQRDLTELTISVQDGKVIIDTGVQYAKGFVIPLDQLKEVMALILEVTEDEEEQPPVPEPEPVPEVEEPAPAPEANTVIVVAEPVANTN